MSEQVAWHASCFALGVVTTVQAGAVRRVIEVAAGYGANRGALWNTAGVHAAVDDGVRLPAARLFDVWSSAARSAPPDLTLEVTRKITLEQLGVFGFAILTAPDGMAALQAVARLFPIVTDSGRWSSQLRERAVVVRWGRAPSPSIGQHLSTEATLGHFVSCARQTFGADAPRLTRVTLGHAVAPERRAALRGYFDCAVEGDTGCDSLEWSREMTDAKPRFANAAMHAHFVAVAEPLVAAVAAPPSAADAVRAQLRRRLPHGESAMAEVARSLGVSTRTLRRRLSDDRVTYHALVDEVRRELASDLLAAPAASITNVALDLGFSDGTAFARAYRRWYGKSPKSARVAPPRVSD